MLYTLPMRRVSNGYTIIEVLIFLAVSGFILVTSMAFFSGRAADNRFAQSMRDIQSKVQDWINDVPTGFAGASSSTTGLGTTWCHLAGIKPQINTSGGPSNGDCIFLGKVIQFTDASSQPTPEQYRKVYAYSVFGRRLNSSGDLTANMIEANPVPAVGIGAAGNADLTDVYTLGGNSKVLSITSSGAVSNSHMAGFFLSFNPLVAERNGSQDLLAYQYKLTTNSAPANTGGGNAVVDCIANLGSCAKPAGVADNQWPQPLQSWRVCLSDPAGKNTALLTISSNNGIGVTTKLEFTPCS